MFDNVFQVFIYILGKCVDFLFSSYISSGVSLGSLIVVCFVFVVMLRYLLNIPRSSIHYDGYDKDLYRQTGIKESKYRRNFKQ